MIALPIKGLCVTQTDIVVLDEILSQEKDALDPKMADEEFFELFAAQHLLRDYRLDPNEVKSGLVSQTANSGSPGTDGGIDAMYLLVNGRLIRDLDQAQELRAQKQNIAFDIIIIQTSSETGFGLDRVVRLKNTSENIFRLDRQTDAFDETYNEELLDCIRRLRETHRALVTKRPTIHVSFFYVTKGSPTALAPDVQSKARSLETDIEATLSTIAKCTFTFVGARDLIDVYRKPSKSTFSLKCIDSIAHKGGHVALVELQSYHRFITDDAGVLIDYLFKSNVRDYEGDVGVNTQILETLRNSTDPADFWWLNNGITVISDKITPVDAKELVIDEPQIVNGLQTSAVIHEYFVSRPPDAPDDKRHVIMRILQSPDPVLQDRVIRATNSQTRIPPQYLWATDALQRDIEQVFRASGLHYDRRKNSWRKLLVEINKW